jgi:hypothetical protein
MRDPILLVLAVVGVVLLVALLGAKVQERRADMLRQAADELGFTFRDSDQSVAAILNGFMLFGHGKASSARNVLRGEAHGLETLILDYHDTLRAGPRLHAFRLSLLSFLKPGEDWPRFSLRPRQRFEGTGEKDVTFEDDPEFSKRYVLRADDADATRRVFSDEVREFFRERPGLWVEAAGPRMVYSTGRMLAPEHLQGFLEEGFEILNVFESRGRPA